jgi:hypothetical protein
MLQQAMKKLRDEISSSEKKHKFVPVIGGFLMQHLKDHPEHAELIVKDDKTVAGSLQAMQSAARKVAAGGVSMLTNEEGFAIVLQYFGIATEQPTQIAEPQVVGLNLSVDDLL